MKLPQLSPPVQRQSAGSPSRQGRPTRGNGSDRSSPDVGADHGIVPSDVQDCYKLRGLAQNLCLADY